MSNMHVAADDLAAYVDRRLTANEREQVEAHLAWCDECRGELREVGETLRTYRPARRHLMWIGPAVAAAAIVLLVVYPLSRQAIDEDPAHRDVPATVDLRPDLADPVVVADPFGARLLQWSRVERADRYRISVFDGAGTVAWRTETGDTSVVLSPSALSEELGPYLWRVDARIGIDRWVESRLEPLTPGDAAVPRRRRQGPRP